MKKLITIVSVGLSIGFALALANADDVTTTSKSVESENSVVTPHQEPGTSGSMSSDSRSGSDSSMSSKDSKSSENMNSSDSPSMKSSKTTTSRSTMQSCTDKNGDTFQKGEVGYKSCMEKKQKTKHADQMGGEMGNDSDMLSQDETFDDSHTETSSS